MRVAILQFSPTFASPEESSDRATALLRKQLGDPSSSSRRQIDLLVLPELALTGYNFASLSEIEPLLEPTAAGISTQWAQKTAQEYHCAVCIGYPEQSNEPFDEVAADGEIIDSSSVTRKNYNATVLVSARGEVLAHYRKVHLYYTDETWACEGPGEPIAGVKCQTVDDAPFFKSTISLDGVSSSVLGMGICMDLNPYKFRAPWDKYEFGSAMSAGPRARVVIVCMAWLAQETPGKDVVDASELPKSDELDWSTLGYWIERLNPLLSPVESSKKHCSGDQSDSDGENELETTVVLANRIGVESNLSPNALTGALEPRKLVIQDTGEVLSGFGRQVKYAGTSCVLSFRADSGSNVKDTNRKPKGRVGVYGRQQEADDTLDAWRQSEPEPALLGRAEEGVLVVDTDNGNMFELVARKGD